MLTLGPRRGSLTSISDRLAEPPPLSEAEAGHLEMLDLLYRSLCALLYNYAPTSGHPGGSISAGRILAGLVFDAMDYDLAAPDREDADLLVLAAGHKAMGLYALWALRDEAAWLAGLPLPRDAHRRLRLVDLLGFRRNPVTRTPLLVALGARALDGHPTPATPFVRVATGASGVGLASAVGLALAARDTFGPEAPRIHVVEGEGGLTPGRAAEALAAAGTASLGNLILHVDWNQASIDSDRVCREGDEPGEYVQWDPAELCLLHDWNVIQVPDGRDLQQVAAAQRAARAVQGQPTAVVYRTVKGWQYGIQGRAAHGAGHRLCSEGFYRALGELTDLVGLPLPACEGRRRCEGDGEGEAVREECFWEALGLVREAMAQSAPLVEFLAGRLAVSRSRLDAHGRHPRPGAPRVEAAFEAAGRSGGAVPAELALTPGSTTTLRGELGRALGYLNRASGGALVTAAADLLGSTSVAAAAEGFPGGYWHATGNPGARLLAAGGICEDAMTGILSGLSAFGRHLGVGASYGAFLAPLGHVAARLHAIGAQARALTFGDPCRPLILVCAHAGLKTGEDGPTHADPQALQLLQENFPRGLAITLTPWEPQEIWPLLCAALARRPALIAVFVTRPPEPVLDRERLGLAPPEAAASGVYVLRRPRGSGDGTVILQESAVTYAFVQEALPRLLQDGLDPWVYAVASAELFDLLPPEEQRRILPEARSLEAIGITGFTLPTMYRWIRSETGRARTLHPFRQGHYPGSGPGERVLAEAGLDGPSQYRAVRDYLGALVT